MRRIRDCSGPWKGIWAQGRVRGTMHAFRLDFAGDAISGGGEDRDGPFTMRGEVDGDRIYLVKAYSRLAVRYDGVWNGSFVAGRSGLVPPAWGLPGTFEIWPEDEKTAFGANERELANSGGSRRGP